MVDLRVIDDPASASVALDPVRSRLLSELHTPASAATLAGRMGLPRQKVNYHLRTLESHGLVRVESRKKWGGLTERRLVATASSYVVSPAALGPVAADPARRVDGRGMDRLSATYLVALAARVVREVGQLLRKSEELNKRLATLSIDTEVTFRSPEDRAAFTSELTAAVHSLVSRYHAEDGAGGRRHRLVIGAYPLPQSSPTAEGAEPESDRGPEHRTHEPPARRGGGKGVFSSTRSAEPRAKESTP